jgi:flagellar hook-associated protein 1
MPGLMAGLEIGKRALLTHQVSLQTIGHNIANVNTPGYTRQRVGITASHPEESANGPIGSGIQVANVRHIRDLFLGKQYREAQKSLGEWTYKQKTLSQIESIFNEPQDNALGDHLNAFWNSWSELSTNPDSASNRNATLATARQLINGFNQLSTSVSELREATDRDLVNLVDEVNRLTSEIAQLNQQIKAQELGNDQAMDLRDARDLLTDQLAAIVDVNVIDKDNGSTIVAMGAMVLVDDNSSFAIGVNAEHKDGVTTNRLVWKNTTVQLQNVTGELAGLLKSRDVMIPAYQAQLDELARAVVQQVNTLHTSGYGLDKTTGFAFFDPNSLTASTIRLNPDIVTDINKIAATQSSEAGVLDGNIALAIAGLRSASVMSRNTATMNDYYASVVGNLGVETREATSFTSNYELLAQQIDNQRQAVQGVSLDEEMANLVKCQHAYDAAARVITVMDEALDTIITGMGMVGR